MSSDMLIQEVDEELRRDRMRKLWRQALDSEAQGSRGPRRQRWGVLGFEEDAADASDSFHGIPDARWR